MPTRGSAGIETHYIPTRSSVPVSGARHDADGGAKGANLDRGVQFVRLQAPLLLCRLTRTTPENTPRKARRHTHRPRPSSTFTKNHHPQTRYTRPATASQMITQPFLSHIFRYRPPFHPSTNVIALDPHAKWPYTHVAALSTGSPIGRRLAHAQGRRFGRGVL